MSIYFLIFSICTICQKFLLFPVSVASESMQPQINSGDIVMVTPLASVKPVEHRIPVLSSIAHCVDLKRGDIVLEAKLTIPNNKQLEHDRGQANSYAKILNARAFVLVSREGIWISERENSFSKTTSYSWAELEDANVFTQVYSVIGNKKYNYSKKKSI